MIRNIFNTLSCTKVSAHCDGPCGVYDPASVRIAAMSFNDTKIVAMDVPDASDKAAYIEYHNKFNRYVAIKEEQAHLAKAELLVLWTDYFKPTHLEARPDLHNVFWKSCKNYAH